MQPRFPTSTSAAAAGAPPASSRSAQILRRIRNRNCGPSFPVQGREQRSAPGRWPYDPLDAAVRSRQKRALGATLVGRLRRRQISLERRPVGKPLADSGGGDLMAMRVPVAVTGIFERLGIGRIGFQKMRLHVYDVESQLL